MLTSPLRHSLEEEKTSGSNSLLPPHPRSFKKSIDTSSTASADNYATKEKAAISTHGDTVINPPERNRRATFYDTADDRTDADDKFSKAEVLLKERMSLSRVKNRKFT